MSESRKQSTRLASDDEGGKNSKQTTVRYVRKALVRAVRLFLAELFGVGLICFVIVAYVQQGAEAPAVPMVVGAVFTWVVWVIGPISGAHVNPAVSIAMCLTRRLPIIYGIIYCVGQLLGAIVGSWMGTLALNDEFVNKTVGITMRAQHISVAQTLGLEALATMILVVAVLSVSDEFRASIWCQGHVTMFPFAFGITITLLASVFGPLTGGSMNPARSLGPAIIHNHFHEQWIYVVGPCIGSFLAVLIYEMIISEGASLPRIKAWFKDKDFDRSRDYEAENDEVNASDF